MDSNPTILVVDDVALFRELGALFLARSGRVHTAHDGKDALEQARRVKPTLMLVDLFMPGMDGEALCRAVRADPELRDAALLVMTGSDSAEDRARALRAGADDVLRKPIVRAELMQAVGRFVQPAGVRGLPRVPFHERVRIRNGSEELVGRAANLSRGGMFVDAAPLPPLHSELRLEFELSDAGPPLRPTAEVVWQRDPTGAEPGMGLRFLGLDGHSAQLLGDYLDAHPAYKITEIAS